MEQNEINPADDSPTLLCVVQEDCRQSVRKAWWISLNEQKSLLREVYLSLFKAFKKLGCLDHFVPNSL